MTPVQKENTDIKLSNLETVRVTIEAVLGAFIVHARIALGAPTTDAFTVSHRTTGIAIWTTQHLVDAIRVAEWLELANLMPEGHDEMWNWRAQLRAPERDKLTEQLSAIAVRFADGSPAKPLEHTS